MGGGASLSCIWEKKYDSSQHWEQCINHTGSGTFNGIAHTNGRRNAETHAKSVTGVYDCSAHYPAQVETCSKGCGYKVTLAKKPHIENATIYTTTSSQAHLKTCSVCGDWTWAEGCSKSGGVLLSCGTGGTCVTCGYNYPVRTHTANIGTSGTNIHCERCGVSIGTHSGSVVQISDTVVNVNSNVTLNAGYSFNSAWDFGSCYAGITNWAISNMVQNVVAGSRTASVSYTVTMQSDNIRGMEFGAHTWYSIKMPVGDANMHVHNGSGKYDITAPTITSVSINPLGSTWSNAREITVTCTDAISDLVDIGIKNSSGSYVVALGAAAKSGTTFTRTFKATLEAGTSGQTFYAVVRDRVGNIREQAFTISYTDAVPPTAPTVTYLSGTQTGWAKSKTIRVTTSDSGRGAVQVAFNKESDYALANQNGNQYYRDFEFTGNVSGLQTRPFYLKDGLNNARSVNVQLGYLDNTAPNVPTITSSGKLGGADWNPNTFFVKITAGADTLSGIKGVEYSTNNGVSWVLRTGASYDLSITASTSLLARTVDNVDIRSGVREVFINIDKGYPEIQYIN